MFLLAFTLMAHQVAPGPQDRPSPPPQTVPAPEIVITGNRMRSALADCLKRKCSPEEEVAAAKKAGVEAFAAGEYREATLILRRALSRNRQYAAQMPMQLSDLYATYADVTEHEGDWDAFEKATRSSVQVLRDQLGAQHLAAIRASARLGDIWLKRGDYVSADGAYQRAQQEAQAAGYADVAGVIGLRRIFIAVARENLTSARRMTVELERSHAGDARFAPMLALARARIAVAAGEDGASEQLLRALRGTGSAAPVLVSAPPYPDMAGGNRGDKFTTELGDQLSQVRSGTGTSSTLGWVDIGFWVRADGSTADAEILRPARNTRWAQPLIKQIAGRRYAVAGGAAGALGVYRVERFTLRGEWESDTGYLAKRRAKHPKLHVVELTQLKERAGVIATP